MSTKPTIVVIAFDRYRSVKRLLDSMSRANYPDDVSLVISVDFKDSGGNRRVREFVDSFEWNHGTKKVILHEKNLGLREHVLRCGDLTSTNGSIIMLEDDLTVGADFYQYAIAALDFSENQSNIGGISLYCHCTNFISRLPFVAIDDGYDNFFLQIASSWGQAWTASQWREFRIWYDSLNTNNSGLAVMPTDAETQVHQKVLNWPDSSWLKFFIVYLAMNDRYFIYPRTAHSTNNSCSGTNVEKHSHQWQVPLRVKSNGYNFSSVNNSLAVYDSHFEIDQNKLKQLIPELAAYDIEVDLYGTKNLNLTNSNFVVTSRQCDSAILSFPIGLKPIELNLGTPCESGDGKLTLAKRSSKFGNSTLTYRDRTVLEYFFGSLAFKQIAKNLFRYFSQ